MKNKYLNSKILNTLVFGCIKPLKDHIAQETVILQCFTVVYASFSILK